MESSGGHSSAKEALVTNMVLTLRQARDSSEYELCQPMGQRPEGSFSPLLPRGCGALSHPLACRFKVRHLGECAFQLASSSFLGPPDRPAFSIFFSCFTAQNSPGI